MITRLLIYMFPIIHVLSCKEELLTIVKWQETWLQPFKTYANVLVLHYDIPPDCVAATFHFQTKQNTSSVIGCSRQPVIINLKHSGLPVFAPGDSELPANFVQNREEETYELQIPPNENEGYITIASPLAGTWFTAQYVWDDQIYGMAQKGIYGSCKVVIKSELFVRQLRDIPISQANRYFNFDLSRNETMFFKLHVAQHLERIVVTATNTEMNRECGIVLYAQIHKIPTSAQYTEKMRVCSYRNQSMVIQCLPGSWVYLKFDNRGSSNGSVGFIFKRIKLLWLIQTNQQLHSMIKYKQQKLTLVHKHEMFAYDYFLNTKEPLISLISVSANTVSVYKMQIERIRDIGGNMEVLMSMLTHWKTPNSNYTIIACIQKNVIEIPKWPDQCIHENLSHTAPLIINGSSKLVEKFIPYPDLGTWFLSVRVFFECKECECSRKCENEYNACLKDCETRCNTFCKTSLDCVKCDECFDTCRSNTVVKNDCSNCNCFGFCEGNNSTLKKDFIGVLGVISSRPCIFSECGKNGKCLPVFLSAFTTFSVCICRNGYRGWTCEDDKYAMSVIEKILAVACFTVSNMAFLFSMYVAYKRRYYTQLVAYTFTMISSTLYHLCDSIYQVSCVASYKSLQFCDFYCATLSAWVTLIAIAQLEEPISSACNIAGAIFIAASFTKGNSFAWIYLAPGIIGVVIVLTSWGYEYYKYKVVLPSMKYLKTDLPIGSALVGIGFICFGMNKTHNSYVYLHSVWHVTSAVAVVFLLPHRRFDVAKRPYEEW